MPAHGSLEGTGAGPREERDPPGGRRPVGDPDAFHFDDTDAPQF